MSPYNFRIGVVILESSREEINMDYWLMCQNVALDLYFSNGNTFEFIQDVIENIENIKNLDLLTSFEKVVRNYFLVNDLPLSFEQLSYDIYSNL